MLARARAALLALALAALLVGCSLSGSSQPTSTAVGPAVTPGPTPLSRLPGTPVSAPPVASPGGRSVSSSGSPAPAGLAFTLLVPARDVDKAFNPVDQTDRFPADAARIYLVAHLGGSGSAELTVRWVAVEATDLQPGAVILERSVEVSGGGRYSFYVEPPAGGRFPVGRYKADLSLDGRLASTVPFSVFPAATAGTPAALARPTASPDPRVTAVLARGVTSRYEPVQPTTVFEATVEKIHLVFTARDLPSDSRLEAVWIAERVDAEVPPDFRIDSASLTLQGSAPGDFTLTRPSTGFPRGSYRVELSLDGRLIGVYPFTVE